MEVANLINSNLFNLLQMIYFHPNHLSDEEISQFVEALFKNRLWKIKPSIKLHVKHCDKCASSIIQCYTIRYGKLIVLANTYKPVFRWTQTLQVSIKSTSINRIVNKS